MSQTIVEMELDQIVPSPTNPRKYFNQASLEELAKSIVLTKGVIQAVTVRPHKTEKGKFELVCGERRYRASRIGNMIYISAVVKNLSDEEVQELQFIENIEREDVHPMDEAVTFKAMIENKLKPWSIEDIAAKITKPASYVAQRLQLNNLIPSLQKEFWDGKFLVGHAILFARLLEQDQKEVVKNYNVFNSQQKAYSPVKNVAEFLDRNIMRKLSAAPFRKDDADLVPEVGACLGCGSRTGGNAVLFPDLKNDDRCLDGKCFANKSQVHLLNEMQKVLTSQPEIYLVQAYGTLPTAITKMAEKYKVHILNIANAGITEHKNSGYTPIKAFWLSGDKCGKITTIYKQMAGKAKLAAKQKAGEELQPADIDEQISGIKQRLQRGKELDYEKIQETVINQIINHCPDGKLLPEQIAEESKDLFIKYLVYHNASRYEDELIEAIGLDEKGKDDFDDNPVQLFDRLKKITPVQFDTMLVHLMMHNFKQNRRPNTETAIMRRLAMAIGVDVSAIIAEQEAIATKRLSNATKRIHELEKQKKELKSKGKKVAPGANKIASSGKKSTSKISKLVA